MNIEHSFEKSYNRTIEQVMFCQEKNASASRIKTLSFNIFENTAGVLVGYFAWQTVD